MRNRTRKNGLKKTYRVYLIPIVMAVVILPLLVMFRQVENSMAGVGWGNDNPFVGDLFLCVKKDFLYAVLGALLFFILCFWLLQRKIFSVPKYFGLLGGYLLLTVISSFTGLDVWTSWHGGVEMLQPVMVVVSYLVLFYFTYIVICGEKNRREAMLFFLNRIFLILALLLSVVGILQLCGLDYLSWSWLKEFLGMEQMQLRDSSRIILTLYHADYVGSMMVLLIPMCCAGAARESSLHWRILYIAAVIGNAVCLFASQSRTGMIALLAGAIFTFALRMIVERGRRLKLVVCLAVVIGIFSALFFLVDQIQNHKTSGRVLKSSSKGADPSSFSSIETGKREIRLKKNKTVLRVSWKRENKEYHFQILDDAGKSVSYSEKTDIDLSRQKKTTVAKAMIGTPVYRFNDRRYEGIYFQENSYFSADKRYDGITLFSGNHAWFFTKNKGKYQYVNRMGRLDDCIAANDALPMSFYPVASYRGYVWSKTLAMLPRVVVLGVGPDNFERFFPNNDYVAKASCDLDSIIYNRPHNWYLQMASESGVLAALMVLGFLIIYVVRVLRENIHECKQDRRQTICHGEMALKYGCFTAILAYLVVSLGNDSMIVVAPVFWTILGVGYALLREPEKN